MTRISGKTSVAQVGYSFTFPIAVLAYVVMHIDQEASVEFEAARGGALREVSYLQDGLIKKFGYNQRTILRENGETFQAADLHYGDSMISCAESDGGNLYIAFMGDDMPTRSPVRGLFHFDKENNTVDRTKVHGEEPLETTIEHSWGWSETSPADLTDLAEFLRGRNQDFIEASTELASARPIMDLAQAFTEGMSRNDMVSHGDVEGSAVIMDRHLRVEIDNSKLDSDGYTQIGVSGAHASKSLQNMTVLTFPESGDIWVKSTPWISYDAPFRAEYAQGTLNEYEVRRYAPTDRIVKLIRAKQHSELVSLLAGYLPEAAPIPPEWELFFPPRPDIHRRVRGQLGSLLSADMLIEGLTVTGESEGGFGLMVGAKLEQGQVGASDYLNLEINRIADSHLVGLTGRLVPKEIRNLSLRFDSNYECCWVNPLPKPSNRKIVPAMRKKTKEFAQNWLNTPREFSMSHREARLLSEFLHGLAKI